MATCALGSGGHAALRFDAVLASDEVQAIVTAMEVCGGWGYKVEGHEQLPLDVWQWCQSATGRRLLGGHERSVLCP